MVEREGRGWRGGAWESAVTEGLLCAGHHDPWSRYSSQNLWKGSVIVQPNVYTVNFTEKKKLISLIFFF